jgi:hypothetical protein
MARLNVQAVVSWTGIMPDEVFLPNLSTFQDVPIDMVLSVTREDGSVVENVLEDHVHIEYLAPRDPSLTAPGTAVQLGSFDHHEPASGGAGWYSCHFFPQPHGTEPSSGWPASEVFLCVTIQRGPDRGQTVVAAKYRRVPLS